MKRTIEATDYFDVDVTFYNSDDDIELCDSKSGKEISVRPWHLPAVIDALKLAHQRWLEHWGPEEAERVTKVYADLDAVPGRGEGTATSPASAPPHGPG